MILAQNCAYLQIVMTDMRKYWNILAGAALVCLLCAGCKKEEDETREYLDGTLSMDFPTYVNPGYSKTYELKSMTTVYRADGGTLGFYVTDPATGARDTLVLGDGKVLKDTFTITVPDTLANLSFTFGAFCEDGVYYGTTVQKSFTVVKPGLNDNASITGFTQAPTSQTLTDPRDGRVYPIVDIAGIQWMRSNLAWSGVGTVFSECEAMRDVFGGFYTWEQAKNACPQGWSLPSDADILQLASSQGVAADPLSHINGLAGKLMGNLSFNGSKMWEYWPAVKITDSAQLSLMPVGYVENFSSDKLKFTGLNEYAAFWTSDQVDGRGVMRYVYQDKDIVYISAVSKKDIAVPVRCVKK